MEKPRPYQKHLATIGGHLKKRRYEQEFLQRDVASRLRVTDWTIGNRSRPWYCCGESKMTYNLRSILHGIKMIGSHMPFSRRSFLTGLVASAISKPALAGTDVRLSADKTPLKNRAARKGLRFGAAIKARLLGDRAYGDLFIRDVGMVIPENAMKWGPIERRRGRYNFSRADAVAEFAATHDMALRGSSLLWHNQMPKWLPPLLSDPKADHEGVITNYVTQIVGRYRGRIYSWNVVNEAIDPKHGRDDGLRVNPYLKALGADYLEIAFRAAVEADPSARLMLNEYGQVWRWPIGRQRRDATLRLLERLLNKKVPIHAYGIQSHLSSGRKGALDLEALGQFCDEIAGFGLEIQITELDVKDTFLSGSIAERDQAVADTYSDFLDVVLARKATKSITTWGITDRYSWLTRRFPRSDRVRIRGLPYDNDYVRKPAWYALAAAMDRAPVR